MKNVFKIFLFFLIVFLLDFAISNVLLRGIKKNYGLETGSEILLMGHSHLMLACDKVLLEKETGLKVSKYTREGVNVADRKIMLEHYFQVCKKAPEIVLLSIDPWLFTSEGLSNNSYALFLPFMDSPEIDKYIKHSVDSYFDYIRPKVIRCNRYNTTLLNASVRGYLGNWNNLKTGLIDTIRIRNEISSGAFRKIRIDNEFVTEFISTLVFLKNKNVKVFLVNSPVWKPVIECQIDDYNRVHNLIHSLTSKYLPEATFIDLLPEFSDKSELFFDSIHLNPSGQKLATDNISKYIQNFHQLNQ
jgi:hypothetical protein